MSESAAAVDAWVAAICRIVDDFDDALFKAISAVNRASLSVDQRIDLAKKDVGGFAELALHAARQARQVPSPDGTEVFQTAFIAELEALADAFRRQESVLATATTEADLRRINDLLIDMCTHAGAATREALSTLPPAARQGMRTIERCSSVLW